MVTDGIVMKESEIDKLYYLIIIITTTISFICKKNQTLEIKTQKNDQITIHLFNQPASGNH